MESTQGLCSVCSTILNPWEEAHTIDSDVESAYCQEHTDAKDDCATTDMASHQHGTASYVLQSAPEQFVMLWN